VMLPVAGFVRLINRMRMEIPTGLLNFSTRLDS